MQGEGGGRGGAGEEWLPREREAPGEAVYQSPRESQCPASGDFTVCTPLGAAWSPTLPYGPPGAPSPSPVPWEGNSADISQRRLRAVKTLVQGHRLLVRAPRGAKAGL